MYSRPFVKIPGRLGVLFDSFSVDRFLPSSDRRSRALLKCHSTEFLDFVRSPGGVEDRGLQEITQFQKKYNDEGVLYSIKITRGESWSERYFSYRLEDMDEIGRVIYGKEELSTAERKTIELVFVQATLNEHKGLNLLVTENAVLLRNRLWFESHTKD